MYKIIDLSQTVDENIGVYPGDSPFQRTTLTTVQNDVYQISLISVGSHCGTHADAPCHFIDNGKAMAELSLEHFVGEAFLINAKYSDGKIDSEYIKSQLKNANGAKILIINTGWSKKIGTPEFFAGTPCFDGDISAALSEAGIITVGIDTPTVTDNESTRSMHVKLLSREIVIVEALVNLDKIPCERFFFSAAPLKLGGSDGSPVRAYALIGQ